MFLPSFHKITLQGEKRPSPAYPKELKTLGDHIRKRREDLGVSQVQAADRMGVDRTTVQRWEADLMPVDDRNLPSIHAFLGYRPDVFPQSFPERLRYWRQTLGLSQIKLSEALGLNHAAVFKWEKGKPISKQSKKRLMAYLSEKLGKEVALT